MHAHPFANQAAIIQNRHRANQHVAIRAVMPAQAVLDIVKRPARDRRRPHAGRVRPVIRVHRVQPAPSLELLESLPGKLAPARLLDLKFARGRRVPHDGRDRLDQRPITLFAQPQAFLRLLEVLELPPHPFVGGLELGQSLVSKLVWHAIEFEIDPPGRTRRIRECAAGHRSW